MFARKSGGGSTIVPVRPTPGGLASNPQATSRPDYESDEGSESESSLASPGQQQPRDSAAKAKARRAAAADILFGKHTLEQSQRWSTSRVVSAVQQIFDEPRAGLSYIAQQLGCNERPEVQPPNLPPIRLCLVGPRECTVELAEWLFGCSLAHMPTDPSKWVIVRAGTLLTEEAAANTASNPSAANLLEELKIAAEWYLPAASSVPGLSNNTMVCYVEGGSRTMSLGADALHIVLSPEIQGIGMSVQGSTPADVKELQQAIREAGEGSSSLRTFFASLDTNGDGVLSKQEIVQGLTVRVGRLKEPTVASAVDHFLALQTASAGTEDTEKGLDADDFMSFILPTSSHYSYDVEAAAAAIFNICDIVNGLIGVSQAGLNASVSPSRVMNILRMAALNPVTRSKLSVYAAVEPQTAPTCTQAALDTAMAYLKRRFPLASALPHPLDLYIPNLESMHTSATLDNVSVSDIGPGLLRRVGSSLESILLSDIQRCWQSSFSLFIARVDLALMTCINILEDFDSARPDESNATETERNETEGRGSDGSSSSSGFLKRDSSNLGHLELVEGAEVLLRELLSKWEQTLEERLHASFALKYNPDLSNTLAKLGVPDAIVHACSVIHVALTKMQSEAIHDENSAFLPLSTILRDIDLISANGEKPSGSEGQVLSLESTREDLCDAFGVLIGIDDLEALRTAATDTTSSLLANAKVPLLLARLLAVPRPTVAIVQGVIQQLRLFVPNMSEILHDASRGADFVFHPAHALHAGLKAAAVRLENLSLARTCLHQRIIRIVDEAYSYMCSAVNTSPSLNRELMHEIKEGSLRFSQFKSLSQTLRSRPILLLLGDDTSVTRQIDVLFPNGPLKREPGQALGSKLRVYTASPFPDDSEQWMIQNFGGLHPQPVLNFGDSSSVSLHMMAEGGEGVSNTVVLHFPSWKMPALGVQGHATPDLELDIAASCQLNHFDSCAILSICENLDVGNSGVVGITNLLKEIQSSLKTVWEGKKFAFEWIRDLVEVGRVESNFKYTTLEDLIFHMQKRNDGNQDATQKPCRPFAYRYCLNAAWNLRKSLNLNIEVKSNQGRSSQKESMPDRDITQQKIDSEQDLFDSRSDSLIKSVKDMTEEFSASSTLFQSVVQTAGSNLACIVLLQDADNAQCESPIEHLMVKESASHIHSMLLENAPDRTNQSSWIPLLGMFVAGESALARQCLRSFVESHAMQSWMRSSEEFTWTWVSQSSQAKDINAEIFEVLKSKNRQCTKQVFNSFERFIEVVQEFFNSKICPPPVSLLSSRIAQSSAISNIDTIVEEQVAVLSRTVSRASLLPGDEMVTGLSTIIHASQQSFKRLLSSMHSPYLSQNAVRPLLTNLRQLYEDSEGGLCTVGKIAALNTLHAPELSRTIVYLQGCHEAIKEYLQHYLGGATLPSLVSDRFSIIVPIKVSNLAGDKSVSEFKAGQGFYCLDQDAVSKALSFLPKLPDVVLAPRDAKLGLAGGGGRTAVQLMQVPLDDMSCPSITFVVEPCLQGIEDDSPLQQIQGLVVFARLQEYVNGWKGSDLPIKFISEQSEIIGQGLLSTAQVEEVFKGANIEGVRPRHIKDLCDFVEEECDGILDIRLCLESMRCASSNYRGEAFHLQQVSQALSERSDVRLVMLSPNSKLTPRIQRRCQLAVEQGSFCTMLLTSAWFKEDAQLALLGNRKAAPQGWHRLRQQEMVLRAQLRLGFKELPEFPAACIPGKRTIHAGPHNAYHRVCMMILEGGRDSVAQILSQLETDCSRVLLTLRSRVFRLRLPFKSCVSGVPSEAIGIQLYNSNAFESLRRLHRLLSTSQDQYVMNTGLPFFDGLIVTSEKCRELSLDVQKEILQAMLPSSILQPTTDFLNEAYTTMKAPCQKIGSTLRRSTADNVPILLGGCRQSITKWILHQLDFWGEDMFSAKAKLVSETLSSKRYDDRIICVSPSGTCKAIHQLSSPDISEYVHELPIAWPSATCFGFEYVVLPEAGGGSSNIESLERSLPSAKLASLLGAWSQRLTIQTQQSSGGSWFEWILSTIEYHQEISRSAATLDADNLMRIQGLDFMLSSIQRIVSAPGAGLEAAIHNVGYVDLPKLEFRIPTILIVSESLECTLSMLAKFFGQGVQSEEFRRQLEQSLSSVTVVQHTTVPDLEAASMRGFERVRGLKQSIRILRRPFDGPFARYLRVLVTPRVAGRGPLPAYLPRRLARAIGQVSESAQSQKEIRKLFVEADVDADGIISVSAFVKLLKKVEGFAERKLRIAMAQALSDNGWIAYDRLLAAMAPAELLDKEENARFNLEAAIDAAADVCQCSIVCFDLQHGFLSDSGYNPRMLALVKQMHVVAGDRLKFFCCISKQMTDRNDIVKKLGLAGTVLSKRLRDGAWTTLPTLLENGHTGIEGFRESSDELVGMALHHVDISVQRLQLSLTKALSRISSALSTAEQMAYKLGRSNLGLDSRQLAGDLCSTVKSVAKTCFSSRLQYANWLGDSLQAIIPQLEQHARGPSEGGVIVSSEESAAMDILNHISSGYAGLRSFCEQYTQGFPDQPMKQPAVTLFGSPQGCLSMISLFTGADLLMLDVPSDGSCFVVFLPYTRSESITAEVGLQSLPRSVKKEICNIPASNLQFVGYKCFDVRSPIYVIAPEIDGNTANDDEDVMKSLQLIRDNLNAQARSLLSIFRSFNLKKSGQLSPSEFLIGLKSCGIELNDMIIQDCFEAIDLDQNKTLDFEEFLCAFRPVKHRFTFPLDKIMHGLANVSSLVLAAPDIRFCDLDGSYFSARMLQLMIRIMQTYPDSIRIVPFISRDVLTSGRQMLASLSAFRSRMASRMGAIEMFAVQPAWLPLQHVGDENVAKYIARLGRNELSSIYSAVCAAKDAHFVEQLQYFRSCLSYCTSVAKKADLITNNALTTVGRLLDLHGVERVIKCIHQASDQTSGRISVQKLSESFVADFETIDKYQAMSIARVLTDHHDEGVFEEILARIHRPKGSDARKKLSEILFQQESPFYDDNSAGFLWFVTNGHEHTLSAASNLSWLASLYKSGWTPTLVHLITTDSTGTDTAAGNGKLRVFGNCPSSALNSFNQRFERIVHGDDTNTNNERQASIKRFQLLLPEDLNSYTFAEWDDWAALQTSILNLLRRNVQKLLAALSGDILTLIEELIIVKTFVSPGTLSTVEFPSLQIDKVHAIDNLRRVLSNSAFHPQEDVLWSGDVSTLIKRAASLLEKSMKNTLNILKDGYDIGELMGLINNMLSHHQHGIMPCMKKVLPNATDDGFMSVTLGCITVGIIAPSHEHSAFTSWLTGVPAASLQENAYTGLTVARSKQTPGTKITTGQDALDSLGNDWMHLYRVPDSIDSLVLRSVERQNDLQHTQVTYWCPPSIRPTEQQLFDSRAESIHGFKANSSDEQLWMAAEMKVIPEEREHEVRTFVPKSVMKPLSAEEAKASKLFVPFEQCLLLLQGKTAADSFPSFDPTIGFKGFDSLLRKRAEPLPFFFQKLDLNLQTKIDEILETQTTEFEKKYSRQMTGSELQRWKSAANQALLECETCVVSRSRARKAGMFFRKHVSKFARELLHELRKRDPENTGIMSPSQLADALQTACGENLHPAVTNRFRLAVLCDRVLEEVLEGATNAKDAKYLSRLGNIRKAQFNASKISQSNLKPSNAPDTAEQSKERIENTDSKEGDSLDEMMNALIEELREAVIDKFPGGREQIEACFDSFASPSSNVLSYQRFRSLAQFVGCHIAGIDVDLAASRFTDIYQVFRHLDRSSWGLGYITKRDWMHFLCPAEDGYHEKYKDLVEVEDTVRSLLLNGRAFRHALTAFRSADKDGDNFVSYGEFEAVLHRLHSGADSAQIWALFQRCDYQRAGKLSYHDFLGRYSAFSQYRRIPMETDYKPLRKPGGPQVEDHSEEAEAEDDGGMVGQGFGDWESQMLANELAVRRKARERSVAALRSQGVDRCDPYLESWFLLSAKPWLNAKSASINSKGQHAVSVNWKKFFEWIYVPDVQCPAFDVQPLANGLLKNTDVLIAFADASGGDMDMHYNKALGKILRTYESNSSGANKHENSVGVYMLGHNTFATGSLDPGSDVNGTIEVLSQESGRNLYPETVVMLDSVTHDGLQMSTSVSEENGLWPLLKMIASKVRTHCQKAVSGLQETVMNAVRHATLKIQTGSNVESRDARAALEVLAENLSFWMEFLSQKSVRLEKPFISELLEIVTEIDTTVLSIVSRDHVLDRMRSVMNSLYCMPGEGLYAVSSSLDANVSLPSLERGSIFVYGSDAAADVVKLICNDSDVLKDIPIDARVAIVSASSRPEILNGDDATNLILKGRNQNSRGADFIHSNSNIFAAVLSSRLRDTLGMVNVVTNVLHHVPGSESGYERNAAEKPLNLNHRMLVQAFSKMVLELASDLIQHAEQSNTGGLSVADFLRILKTREHFTASQTKMVNDIIPTIRWALQRPKEDLDRETLDESEGDIDEVTDWTEAEDAALLVKLKADADAVASAIQASFQEFGASRRQTDRREVVLAFLTMLSCFPDLNAKEKLCLHRRSKAKLLANDFYTYEDALSGCQRRLGSVHNPSAPWGYLLTDSAQSIGFVRALIALHDREFELLNKKQRQILMKPSKTDANEDENFEGAHLPLEDATINMALFIRVLANVKCSPGSLLGILKEAREYDQEQVHWTWLASKLQFSFSDLENLRQSPLDIQTKGLIKEVLLQWDSVSKTRFRLAEFFEWSSLQLPDCVQKGLEIDAIDVHTLLHKCEDVVNGSHDIEQDQVRLQSVLAETCDKLIITIDLLSYDPLQGEFTDSQWKIMESMAKRFSEKVHVVGTYSSGLSGSRLLSAKSFFMDMIRSRIQPENDSCVSFLRIDSINGDFIELKPIQKLLEKVQTDKVTVAFSHLLSDCRAIEKGYAALGSKAGDFSLLSLSKAKLERLKAHMVQTGINIAADEHPWMLKLSKCIDSAINKLQVALHATSSTASPNSSGNGGGEDIDSNDDGDIHVGDWDALHVVATLQELFSRPRVGICELANSIGARVDIPEFETPIISIFGPGTTAASRLIDWIGGSSSVLQECMSSAPDDLLFVSNWSDREFVRSGPQVFDLLPELLRKGLSKLPQDWKNRVKHCSLKKSGSALPLRVLFIVVRGSSTQWKVVGLDDACSTVSLHYDWIISSLHRVDTKNTGYVLKRDIHKVLTSAGVGLRLSQVSQMLEASSLQTAKKIRYFDFVSSFRSSSENQHFNAMIEILAKHSNSSLVLVNPISARYSVRQSAMITSIRLFAKRKVKVFADVNGQCDSQGMITLPLVHALHDVAEALDDRIGLAYSERMPAFDLLSSLRPPELLEIIKSWPRFSSSTNSDIEPGVNGNRAGVKLFDGEEKQTKIVVHNDFDRVVAAMYTISEISVQRFLSACADQLNSLILNLCKGVARTDAVSVQLATQTTGIFERLIQELGILEKAASRGSAKPVCELCKRFKLLISSVLRIIESKQTLCQSNANTGEEEGSHVMELANRLLSAVGSGRTASLAAKSSGKNLNLPEQRSTRQQTSQVTKASAEFTTSSRVANAVLSFLSKNTKALVMSGKMDLNISSLASNIDQGVVISWLNSKVQDGVLSGDTQEKQMVVAAVVKAAYLEDGVTLPKLFDLIQNADKGYITRLERCLNVASEGNVHKDTVMDISGSAANIQAPSKVLKPFSETAASLAATRSKLDSATAPMRGYDLTTSLPLSAGIHPEASIGESTEVKELAQHSQKSHRDSKEEHSASQSPSDPAALVSKQVDNVQTKRTLLTEAVAGILDIAPPSRPMIHAQSVTQSFKELYSRQSGCLRAVKDIIHTQISESASELPDVPLRCPALPKRKVVTILGNGDLGSMICEEICGTKFYRKPNPEGFDTGFTLVLPGKPTTTTLEMALSDPSVREPLEPFLKSINPHQQKIEFGLRVFGTAQGSSAIMLLIGPHVEGSKALPPSKSSALLNSFKAFIRSKYSSLFAAFADLSTSSSLAKGQALPALSSEQVLNVVRRNGMRITKGDADELLRMVASQNDATVNYEDFLCAFRTGAVSYSFDLPSGLEAAAMVSDVWFWAVKSTTMNGSGQDFSAREFQVLYSVMNQSSVDLKGRPFLSKGNVVIHVPRSVVRRGTEGLKDVQRTIQGVSSRIRAQCHTLHKQILHVCLESASVGGAMGARNPVVPAAKAGIAWRGMSLPDSTSVLLASIAQLSHEWTSEYSDLIAADVNVINHHLVEVQSGNSDRSYASSRSVEVLRKAHAKAKSLSNDTTVRLNCCKRLRSSLSNLCENLAAAAQCEESSISSKAADLKEIKRREEKLDSSLAKSRALLNQKRFAF